MDTVTITIPRVAAVRLAERVERASSRREWPSGALTLRAIDLLPVRDALREALSSRESVCTLHATT